MTRKILQNDSRKVIFELFHSIVFSLLVSLLVSCIFPRFLALEKIQSKPQKCSTDLYVKPLDKIYLCIMN